MINDEKISFVMRILYKLWFYIYVIFRMIVNVLNRSSCFLIDVVKIFVEILCVFLYNKLWFFINIWNFFIEILII